jgi:NAD(P)-dependent dehydrogenase (short-subunit alcohol dehydrogenase family)
LPPVNLFDLTNKVAVVTGGTGTLGAAMCMALAEAGAKVAILARRAEPGEALAKTIQAAGGVALPLAADVLDKQSLETAAAKVSQAFGKIDILINGAGGNKPEATAVPGQRTFFDLPAEALAWVLQLNLMGSLLPTQVFAAPMIAQQAGVIINISSMAAFTPLTRVVAYGAAKAAINNFTQWLAVYMAREHSPNIRVNAIAPGFFLGEQNRFLLIDQGSGELTARGKQILDHTPMGRFGAPADLVGTLLWLASDAARFVTGVVVPVDGGFNAYGGV